MTDRENNLFKILIITLLASGGALLALRSVGDYYRQQLWIATQAALPFHHISSVVKTHANSSQVQSSKIYINSKYGFEFQYPSNLVLSEVEDGVTIIDPSNIEKIEIYIFPLAQFNNLEDWLKNEYKDEIDFSTKKILYLTNPSKVKIAQVDSLPGESSDNAASLVISGNYVIEIIGSPVSESLASYNAIVNSLKLTK